MSKYRISQIIFVFTLSILLLLYYRYNISLIIILVSIVLYLSVIALGSYLIKYNFYLPVINNGNSGKMEIAITFDDGPHKHNTPMVLDILKKHRVKAAFFCIGDRIPGNESLLEKIYTQGHIVGNHSWKHTPVIDFYPAKYFKNQLVKTTAAIEAVINKKIRFFRPPFGVTNPFIAKAVKQLDLETIGWSIRSLDTIIDDHQKLLNRITGKLHNGSILLLHDTTCNITVLLDSLLIELKKRNYNIVRLDQLIKREPYE